MAYAIAFGYAHAAAIRVAETVAAIACPSRAVRMQMPLRLASEPSLAARRSVPCKCAEVVMVQQTARAVPPRAADVPGSRPKPRLRKSPSSSEAAAAEAAPVRVAIVGGGCAGLAAAWELSQLPGYEVHVYERSFRLGGKGASGRDKFGRIHEHGLHVWLGFYENAFGMMRDCYAEVEAMGWGPRSAEGRRLSHATFDEAFFSEPHIGVGGADWRNDFKVWSGFLPPAEGQPGEKLDSDSNPYTLASYLLRTLDLIRTLIQSSVAAPAAAQRPADADGAPTSPEELVARMRRFLQASALTSATAVVHALGLVEQWVRALDTSRQRSSQVTRVLIALATQARAMFSDMALADPALRWKSELVDIVLAIAVGLIRDRVLFRRQGFDSINDLDYRAWLTKHGASRAAVDSRFIAGIYELVFAYEDGDHKRPAFAAGVALRCALRMFFTYRGSMFWRLRSGMGDAVFAPLYRVMLTARAATPARGARSAVRFHFLHALRRIRLASGKGGRPYVQGLDFDIHGDPDRISDADPSCALDHFGCWPVDPDRLGGSTDATGQRQLQVDADFDAVVLATGIDDLITVFKGNDKAKRTRDSKGDPRSPNLFESLPPRWKRMAETTRTVATQSAQVWLDGDFTSLGWQSDAGIVTALDIGFDTLADMTHTLATERAWREASGEPADARIEQARSVAYFCSVLAERELQGVDSPALVVATRLYRFLGNEAQSIWPRAFESGRNARQRAVQPAGLILSANDLTRSVSANTQGSERYTLSVPGSLVDRISPLDASVTNMTVAGDWTACGLDSGCVEAAVISGKLAAHAISGGFPTLESIVGYDHP